MSEVAKQGDILAYPGVDWALCLELTADNESLAKDLLQMFVDSLPNDLDVLQQAYADNDLTALKDRVHKIHGALCYCGIPAMKVAVLGLEKACLERLKHEVENQAEIDMAYQKVTQEIQQLLDFVA